MYKTRKEMNSEFGVYPQLCAERIKRGLYKTDEHGNVDLDSHFEFMKNRKLGRPTKYKNVEKENENG